MTEIGFPWRFEGSELQLLRLLHRKDGWTRSALARRSGLSSATISVTVQRLMEHGLLRESGAWTEGVGRPAAVLELSSEAWSVLTYELAPQSIRVGLLTATGQVLETRHHPFNAESSRLNAGDLVGAMARMGRQLVDDWSDGHTSQVGGGTRRAGAVIGAAVSVSGVVHSGTLVHSAGLRLRDVPIAEPLSQELQLPVWVMNDMDARALAEFRYGAGSQRDHMLMVAIEPAGIGAGLIKKGEPLQGSQGSALELGHMTVERHGLACPCGKRGCLEVYSSEAAIVSRAGVLQQRRAGRDAGPAATACETAQVESLWRLATSDSNIRRVFEDALDYFGIAVSNLVTLLDPDLVVVGGHLMRLLHPWGMEKLVSDVRSNVFQPGEKEVRFVPAALGPDAGLAGASFFAVQRLLGHV
ncbi:ROK family transcriptional regulator [Limnochorda pilosa]|uniref:HTH marR-type domain-containing protein n=1 Tax=Limnochorda pilosa TaxID=1555112 RepID=A0A0K2SL47_LIMPI|nr:ROK family transcriptional regulator [Limnochorda pilosa]BAS27838.1 hypothetical protein LIP_1997 [Limnochorda pilosa]